MLVPDCLCNCFVHRQAAHPPSTFRQPLANVTTRNVSPMTMHATKEAWYACRGQRIEFPTMFKSKLMNYCNAAGCWLDFLQRRVLQWFQHCMRQSALQFGWERLFNGTQQKSCGCTGCASLVSLLLYPFACRQAAVASSTPSLTVPRAAAQTCAWIHHVWQTRRFTLRHVAMGVSHENAHFSGAVFVRN